MTNPTKPTELDALKACPFCQGRPRIVKDDTDKRFLAVFTVRCDCGCDRGGHYSKKSAIEQWNRRTP